MALSIAIKPLNLQEALKLYDLIGEYIPENDSQQFIEFVGTIIDNIAEDHSGAYADAICLMTKHSLRELTEFSSEYLLELFTVGLVTNDIIGLRKFCKEIRYG